MFSICLWLLNFSLYTPMHVRWIVSIKFDSLCTSPVTLFMILLLLYIFFFPLSLMIFYGCFRMLSRTRVQCCASRKTTYRKMECLQVCKYHCTELLCIVYHTLHFIFLIFIVHSLFNFFSCFSVLADLLAPHWSLWVDTLIILKLVHCMTILSEHPPFT